MIYMVANGYIFTQNISVNKFLLNKGEKASGIKHSRKV